MLRGKIEGLQCEGLLRDLAFVLFRAFLTGERLKGGELLEDNSSSARVSTLSEIMAPSPYCVLSDAQLNHYLVHLFQCHDFFLYGPTTGHSLVACVRRELATPSFVSLAPPASSPCLDANGGIDLLVI